METVTTTDVRELLESKQPDPNLVLLEGRVTVVPAKELEGGCHPGALYVVSRKALTDRLGRREFSAHDLEVIAGNLNSAVSNLGG
ncbi:hypothetical protein [Amycolatopsis anabasis]|uniref:hypothetical protein n=1 Tax=Amycolatopsis anabasis TaxID=1840409 RepID=UPI00131D9680|nr:hypothetical protein [Amycolatopsis anabasis]